MKRDDSELKKVPKRMIRGPPLLRYHDMDEEGQRKKKRVRKLVYYSELLDEQTLRIPNPQPADPRTSEDDQEEYKSSYKPLHANTLKYLDSLLPKTADEKIAVLKQQLEVLDEEVGTKKRRRASKGSRLPSLEVALSMIGMDATSIEKFRREHNIIDDDSLRGKKWRGEFKELKARPITPESEDGQVQLLQKLIIMVVEAHARWNAHRKMDEVKIQEEEAKQATKA